jgi:uncharacterized cupredoxin-like copper-binding protein
LIDMTTQTKGKAVRPKAKKVFAVATCALALLATNALAHGDEHKSGHKATSSPVVKEQKPWGVAGDATDGIRTIRVSMNDQMRFVPDRIHIREGETVRLVVKNDGKLMHEFVIGTKKELDEHAALMKKFRNMEHDEPYMVHVASGGTGEIVWTFNRAGDFDFGCLIAGHYEAGMVGKIKVNGGGAAARQSQ